MFEAATGDDEREVLVAVGVGIAEAAAVEDLGAVEQGAAGFVDGLKCFQEVAEGGHLRFFDLLQLGDLVGFVAVVGEAVGFALHAGHMRHDAERAERERDDARAVCLQGEADQVEHELGPCDDLIGIGDVFGLRVVHFGFGAIFPLDVALEAVFEFPHALEVLIKSRPILRGGAFFESLGFVEDQIEHTATGFDAAHGRGFFLGRSGDEQASIKPLGARFRRQNNAGARDGDGVGIVLALAHRNSERGKAGVEPDLLRDKLIEREAVAKRGLPRMRRTREEALPGMVITIDTRMREAAESGEVRTMRSDEVEIGAGGLTRLWEEKLRHHAQRHMNGEKPLRRQLFSRTPDGRQSEASASSAEEVSAGCHGLSNCVDSEPVAIRPAMNRKKFLPFSSLAKGPGTTAPALASRVFPAMSVAKS